MSYYHIGQNRYRILDNQSAGQLYLALLGKPHLCKDKKRSIFEDRDLYLTIFDYSSDADTRFDNDRIGLIQSKVNLQSGNVNFFVEDVLFAIGVYQLSDAYKKKYREKLDSYDSSEVDSNSYRILKNDHDFIRLWHYYVVASFNHIVCQRTKTRDDARKLRELIVGSDINEFWDGTLHRRLTLDKDMSNFQVLDIGTSATGFPLFSKWVTSLAWLTYEVFTEANKADPEITARSFIDHRSETYGEILRKVRTKLGAPSQIREEWFPTK